MIKLPEIFNTSKKVSGAIALLSLTLIMVIVLNLKHQVKLENQSSRQVISLLSTNQQKIHQEVFSFIPGLSLAKIPKIDLEGLNYLSYFDLPLDKEGKLNKTSRTFKNLSSDESKKLFSEAHLRGVKVLLTITGSDLAQQKLLAEENLQQELIDSLVVEIKDLKIDGVTVNFESASGYDNLSSNKFTIFLSKLKDRLHLEDPKYFLTVAIPSSENKSSLAKFRASSDKVLMEAWDFAVPESENTKVVNPVYGYAQEIYKDLVLGAMNKFLETVPAENLVLERAWYGNGNRYPLYTPKNTEISQDLNLTEGSPVILNDELLHNLTAKVPVKARAEARKNIPIIAAALEREGILNSNVLAYALATIEHETAGTFQPLEEYYGRLSARRRGYEGGINYFGRGFIQLTHLRNYLLTGKRIGLGEKLAENPAVASEPIVAAKVLAAFFKDNNVSNLASKGRFVAARNPINPDGNGKSIASLALKYWKAIESSKELAWKL